MTINQQDSVPALPSLGWRGVARAVVTTLAGAAAYAALGVFVGAALFGLHEDLTTATITSCVVSTCVTSWARRRRAARDEAAAPNAVVAVQLGFRRYPYGVGGDFTALFRRARSRRYAMTADDLVLLQERKPRWRYAIREVRVPLGSRAYEKAEWGSTMAGWSRERMGPLRARRGG